MKLAGQWPAIVNNDVHCETQDLYLQVGNITVTTGAYSPIELHSRMAQTDNRGRTRSLAMVCILLARFLATMHLLTCRILHNFQPIIV